MTAISIKDAKNRLTELARRVEKGETVTVTRNGKPVIDLVPHKSATGLDFKSGADYLKKHGVNCPFAWVARDFDAPLPEDFLLRSLP
jgi:prevent-host-death family protein